jgi:hypothetical protein
MASSDRIDSATRPPRGGAQVLVEVKARGFRFAADPAAPRQLGGAAHVDELRPTRRRWVLLVREAQRG